MADQRRPGHAVTAPRATVLSCWMCGRRLPADSLVADGGAACADVRWYCRDLRSCTELWTSHRVEPAAPLQPAPQQPAELPQRRTVARPDVARPAAV